MTLELSNATVQEIITALNLKAVLGMQPAQASYALQELQAALQPKAEEPQA